MSSHSFGRQSLSPCFRLVMDVHITLHYDLLLRHHEGLRTMDMKVSSRFSAGAMSAFALAILMAGCVGGASLTASAAPFTITGTGRVVCDSVTGSVKLTPALVAGLTGQVTARVKLVGTSCGKAGASTGDGLHVTKMVIKGLLTVPGDRTCLVGDTQSQIPGSGGFKITYVRNVAPPSCTRQTSVSGVFKVSRQRRPALHCPCPLASTIRSPNRPEAWKPTPI